MDQVRIDRPGDVQVGKVIQQLCAHLPEDATLTHRREQQRLRHEPGAAGGKHAGRDVGTDSGAGEEASDNRRLVAIHFRSHSRATVSLSGVTKRIGEVAFGERVGAARDVASRPHGDHRTVS
jgi:hypothetical protein